MYCVGDATGLCLSAGSLFTVAMVKEFGLWFIEICLTEQEICCFSDFKLCFAGSTAESFDHSKEQIPLLEGELY